MLKIATPISHLFSDPESAQDIIRASDCLECRNGSVEATYPAQEVFHCHIQPIHEMGRQEFAYLKNLARNKPDLRLITFHAASSCHEPVLKDGIFQPGGRSYERGELLENARKNLPEIKAVFGPQVDIAIENNNFYPTPAYQWVTDAAFLSEAVYENDIFFLFDMSHARITVINRQQPYEEYLSGLPLKRLIQIHICRFEIQDGTARDIHQLPTEEDWAESLRLVKECPGTRYITVEYYQDKTLLIESLNRARRLFDGIS